MKRMVLPILLTTICVLASASPAMAQVASISRILTPSIKVGGVSRLTLLRAGQTVYVRLDVDPQAKVDGDARSARPANYFASTLTYPEDLFSGTGPDTAGSVCGVVQELTSPANGSSHIACGMPGRSVAQGATMARFRFTATRTTLVNLDAAFGMVDCSMLADDGLATQIGKGCAGQFKVTAATSELAALPFGSARSLPVRAVPGSCARFGDINCDDSVDSRDVSVLFNAWQSTLPHTDLNADGRTNIIDYSLLMENYSE